MSVISRNNRISIRPAREDDVDAILRLGVECLGWQGDHRDRQFFAWKHAENPFGRSPSWVAESGNRVVGFRTFLRWRLRHGTANETLEVVRAVDTATHPDFRGLGIFRDLTMSALEELAAEGVGAVFNTPNPQSMPGYLKMGWITLGRPVVIVRPMSFRGASRLVRARTAADLWPDPHHAPAHGAPVSDLPEQLFPTRATWRTDRSAMYRRWRYGFVPLGYRQLGRGDSKVVYRLRRRGAATEIALCEVHGGLTDLLPDLRTLGDFALSVGRTSSALAGVPLRRGPVVVWRPLRMSDAPSLSELDLCLADLELF